MKRSPLKRSSPMRKRGESRDNALLRDARAAALERDNYECQARLRGLPNLCAGALHGHHVLPRGRGGLDHPSNLITVCAYHHDIIHLYPAQAYELGLLQRSGDTPCAGCTHVERLHARGGQCTYGPELGHECPCGKFIEPKEEAA